MQIRLPSTTCCLLLISTLQINIILASAKDTSDNQLVKDADLSGPSPSLAVKPVGDGVGTKDAPVDGKDGRPHLGPFVETSAERDRKKAKEGGDKDAKPPPKEIPKAAAAENMPETNDGVMDDPHRTGPKEGTRGTEGGISEKSQSKKEASTESVKVEKKPDPPKEIPPLPHSEQESLGKISSKDDAKKGKDEVADDDDKKKDDKTKEPGGLEV